MKTVGLTGGIASGKSTVGRLLVERGVPLIDADQVARAVVEPGSEGLAAVVDAFGADILQPDGFLDRKALGKVVIADPDARRRLEAITHPLIIAGIVQRLGALAAAGARVAVVEAALMVETRSFRHYDAVLLVRCTEQHQVQRLAQREGWAEERARGWLGAQLSLDEKQRLLDQAAATGGPVVEVVHNDGSLDQLVAATDAAWGRVCAALGLDV